MYGKMFEQAESFLKPMNEIWALNVEIMDTLNAKQTSLFNEVVSDSVEFAKGMTKPDLDIDAVVAAQKKFWEGLGTKIATSTQDNIELISGVQDKVGDLFQSGLSTLESTAVEVAKTKPAPKKKAAARKSTTKSAPKVEESSADA